MKLPALWMACAFASGIALAMARAPASALGRPNIPAAAWIAAAIAAIVAGGVLAWRGLVVTAWACALAAWFAVGGAAAGLERASLPAKHVTRLIAEGRLDTSEPLRWRGRLRDDPVALPWGQRYEIDLEQVEVQGAAIPLSGGLRADLYASDGERAGKRRNAEAPAGLRAGDRVELLMRARQPRNFLDPGAFDLRGYLALQKIDLTGSLRSGELLRLVDRPRPSLLQRVARARGDLLARLDALFAPHPERAAVLRAMLLGDRSFVDSETVTAFQKTSAYHILVVAGLHVGALVAFLFWICRRLRMRIETTSAVALLALAAYVAVVQDRAPILRAALMAAFYLVGRPLFRKIDLLNTVALAALALLIWKPMSLGGSSFQLSFAAAGVIAGLAIPWMERTSAPYLAALSHLSDVTRDGLHSPKVTRFRLDMRDAAAWLASRLPARIASRAGALVTWPIRAGLRLWEIVLLSVVIQWGMLPLLAADFHRVSLQGPIGNIPAVILTAAIVPLGFVTLAASFAWAPLALVLAKCVTFCAGLLLASVGWFSRLPHTSYRIPGPALWLGIAFAAALVALASAARQARARAAAMRRERGSLAMRSMAQRVMARAEPLAAAALLLFTILVAAYPFAPSLGRGKLEVNVLDVGQGDSSFVVFPNGRTLLIDGGGLAGSERVRGYRSGFDVGEQVVSPYLWSRGIKKIDAIAVTHGDHDHLDGLHSVIENFRVGELWVGREEKRTAFENLVAEAREHGVRVIDKKEGDRFDWGGAAGEILWPNDNAPRAKPSNDDSLVLRITDGSRRFLFTGDIQERAERELVREGGALTSDFLKVPHHGSKTSSTERFLEAVAPRVAVVSVGEANAFGQPADSVLERYAKDGARLLRTDQDGEVSARTDGVNLEIATYADARKGGSDSARGEKFSLR